MRNDDAMDRYYRRRKWRGRWRKTRAAIEYVLSVAALGGVIYLVIVFAFSLGDQ